MFWSLQHKNFLFSIFRSHHFVLYRCSPLQQTKWDYRIIAISEYTFGLMRPEQDSRQTLRNHIAVDEEGRWKPTFQISLYNGRHTISGCGAAIILVIQYSRLGRVADLEGAIFIQSEAIALPELYLNGFLLSTRQRCWNISSRDFPWVVTTLIL